MGVTDLSRKKDRLAKKWQREHTNRYLSSILQHYPEHRLFDVPKPNWNYTCFIEFFELEKKLNIVKKEHSYTLKVK